MASCRLSSKAEQEVEQIYAYSIENFGFETAIEYVDGLHQRMQILAENPTLGRDYNHVEHGLKRYEHRSHSIYYIPDKGGIFIVRILGARQDPARHF